MPANEIRRSDDKANEKYDKLADYLMKNKGKYPSNTPSFYEYGLSTGLNEADVSYIPPMMTNMINLSDLRKDSQEVGQEKTASIHDDKVTRANQRRVVAQIELYEDKDAEKTNIDDCPQCKGDNIELDYVALNQAPEGISPYLCHDCGYKWDVDDSLVDRDINDEMLEQQLKDEFPFPHGDENMVDVISSVEALLPQVTAKSNAKMNKMAANIVKGLITSSNLKQDQKLWFNAQVDNGIASNDVFVRNLKTAMSMQKESGYVEQRAREDFLRAKRLRKEDPRYTLGDRFLKLLNPYEYAARTQQEIAGGDVEKSNTSKRLRQDKATANQMRKQDPKYTLGDRVLRLLNPYEYTKRTQEEIRANNPLETGMPTGQPLKAAASSAPKHQQKLQSEEINNE